MLELTWIVFRFIHFTSLMLVFGSALYGAWLAPVPVSRLMARRFLCLQQRGAWGIALSAALMLALQGGLMGGGWRDTASVAVWGEVLQTQFGGVWIWQIVLGMVTLAICLIQPRQLPRLLVLLTTAQFLLLAGVGHATLHVGLPGVAQKLIYALHLLCAAAWFGGLLPVIYCMRIAKGRWRQQAVVTMMRFSRCGHGAVAGVLLTGILNTLFISGFAAPWRTLYGQFLLLKGALVLLMVAIALANRYVLVPRMRRDSGRAADYFIWMTQLEWWIAAAVLALVSLFATLEPF